ncbi:MAG: nucleotidyltransferase family protein [Acidobacteriota bacterium]
MNQLRNKRETILGIALKYGASNLRIFGSSVRNEDGPDSDVDILVDFEPSRSLFDLIGLKLELEETLGLTIDLVTERGLHPMIAGHVLEEAVNL